MTFLRALISRSWIGVVFIGVTAFGIGFGGYSIAHAADSTVTPTFVEQNTPNPIQHFWTGASGTGLETRSGQVWVTGDGDMQVPTADQNMWVTGFYGQDMHCVIVSEPPRARWVIDAKCYLWIRATAKGYNADFVDDDCRAETTGTVEMKGTFKGFNENQVVVDNYTGATRGWVNYDAHGGGPLPQFYADGGVYNVKNTSDRPTVPVTNETACGLDVTGEKWTKVADIFIYTRGKQYMFAHGGQSCQDTDLATEIRYYLVDSDGNPISGWTGTLTSSYWDDGAQQWVQIHVHTIPTGAR